MDSNMQMLCLSGVGDVNVETFTEQISWHKQMNYLT